MIDLLGVAISISAGFLGATIGIGRREDAIRRDRIMVARYVRDRCAEEDQHALGMALAAEIGGKEGMTGGGDGEVPRGGSGPAFMGGGA